MDGKHKDENFVDAIEQTSDFIILGEHSAKRRVKATRVLPDWLADPTIIDASLDSQQLAVEDLPGLNSLLVWTLCEKGIKKFFPVQREVIPWLLKSERLAFTGRQPDVCVSAPTGSGKTLTYVLPLVQALNDRLICTVRALVILPVKDLAFQVFQVFRDFCKGTTLKVGLAAGVDLLTKEQNSLVKTGPCGTRSLADIVVATPGRLLDHIQYTPGFSLADLRYLVIDEADRMMKDMQYPWMVAVEKAFFGNDLAMIDTCHSTACAASNLMPSFRKLLFSATLSQDPERLQTMGLFHPRLFTTTTNSKTTDGDFVGKYATPAELSEFRTSCQTQIKPLVVWYLLQHRGFRRVLCFTNSVSNTNRLCLLLKEMGSDLHVEAFSSDLPQKKRSLLLRRFVRGDVDVLITSDVLTRGMDVENVGCTLLYDCPPLLKTYIHRVGRTARAGRKGTAITLVEPKQDSKFNSMMSAAGKESLPILSVTQRDLQPFDEIYRVALTRVSQLMLQEKSRNQRQKNPFHSKTKTQIVKHKQIQNCNLPK